MLEKIFRLSTLSPTITQELLAGLITFLTMSYILIVNPVILGETGMNKAALFTSTALVAMISTLLMAFLANIPVAQAPGMGMNTFFASTVVMTMGYSWQFALTAVFIEGLIFILLTCFNMREILVQKIPHTLKNAIPAGIGLFIAFIGLQQAGIVVANPHTMVTLGDWTNSGIWVALFGLITIGTLLARNIPGSILIGILLSTVLALFLGVTHWPDGMIVSVPPSIAPIFAQFEWTQIFSFDMLIVVFTFLMVNLFDTIGTLVGVASKAGLMDKNGNFPQVKKALFADALGTTIGSVMGNSVVTSYVESASGVASGGRTGLTAVSTAFMFLIALFLSPIFLIVPVQATAPALIIVGLFMLSSVLNINFSDYTESIPAYLTIIVMPFTYSIAEGIIFGILGFVFIKFLTGKLKDISIPIYLIALLFFIKIIVDIVILT
jgi:AGZA family xanthine/uracil permease-like MFS transporter